MGLCGVIKNRRLSPLFPKKQKNHADEIFASNEAREKTLKLITFGVLNADKIYSVSIGGTPKAAAYKQGLNQGG
jgi:hypothetical protein